MRKLILIGLVLFSINSYSQPGQKISDMPTFIGNPAGGWVPIVIGGANRKVDANYFGYSKLSYFDTSSMLGPYLRSSIAAAQYATIAQNSLKLNIADTIPMLNPYLRISIAAMQYATIANLNAAIAKELADSAYLKGLINTNTTNIANNTASILLKNNITDTMNQIREVRLNSDSTGIQYRRGGTWTTYTFGNGGYPPTASVSVATYAAMIALGTPSVFTVIKVTSDENKGITNSVYQWWASGKRIWIATTEDN